LDKTPKESQSAYLKDLQGQQKIDEKTIEHQYIMENGNKVRVPYRLIRRVVFSNLKKNELLDLPHSARLQYRLMLMDAVLKASVQFARNSIIITYNPKNADNLREKISLEEIIRFLAKEGVHFDKSQIDDQPYDYYKDFYSYAFNPPSIREHVPYSYTPEEWKKMKPKWEAQKAKGKKVSEEKFRQFQKGYIAEHPELAKELGVEAKP